MKNYLVKATINFDDTTEQDENGLNIKRKANVSTWYCDKERYEFLKEHNAVILMGINKIETPKEKINIIFDEKEIIKKNVKPKTSKKKKSSKK